MRNILFILTLFCLLFTSCKNNNASVDNITYDSTVVSNSPVNNSLNTTTNAVLPLTVDSTKPAQPVTVPAAPTTTSSAAGMNPAHGLPGHRCDIAVGAPLNSPAGKAAVNTPTPTVTTSTVSTPPVATPVKTAPGMNPPHGQPGHRCDIGVGAPLNTAPAAKTVSTEPKTAEPEKPKSPAVELAPASIAPAKDSSGNK